MRAINKIRNLLKPVDAYMRRSASATETQSHSFAMGEVVVITGCARSGTTAICQTLGLASNAEFLSEPMPNLARECRDYMDGRNFDPEESIAEAIIPRAVSARNRGLIYGEKNVTLAPFIPHLAKLLEARFVWVTRDGREVVRSLLNWHNQMFGNIYRECSDEGSLSERARRAVSELAVEDDTSDYARPRPGPGDNWHDKWAELSRLEMCAWYWSRINELIMDHLEELPEDRWIRADYTSPAVETIEDVAGFIGLEGLERGAIQAQLEAKINSVEDRTGEAGRFPSWEDWSSADRVHFDAIAAKTMIRLGYYPTDYVRYRPENYGEWWRAHEGGVEWYTWMYESRRSAHEDLLAFVRSRNEQNDPIQSILDVGCGRAVGYADHFADRRFVGMDLSDKEVAWCRENRPNPRHDYIAGDIVRDPPREKFDLVFSQGTIDNVYDMHAYLKAMVECSKKYVYVTCYRGWFPELPEHRYTWDESTTCFYNDLSPDEVKRFLESLGCREISVEPLKMEEAAVEYETRIIARVP